MQRCQPARSIMGRFVLMFEEIPSLTLTRVDDTVDTTKTVIFNVKSLHLIMILIYFI